MKPTRKDNVKLEPNRQRKPNALIKRNIFNNNSYIYEIVCRYVV